MSIETAVDAVFCRVALMGCCCVEFYASIKDERTPPAGLKACGIGDREPGVLTGPAPRPPWNAGGDIEPAGSETARGQAGLGSAAVGAQVDPIAVGERLAGHGSARQAGVDAGAGHLVLDPVLRRRVPPAGL